MAIAKELDLDRETSIGFGKKRDNDLIILGQKMDMVVNYNDVFAVRVENRQIKVLGNNSEYLLGTYKTAERAQEVLYDLISCIGLEPMFQLPKA